MRLVRGRYFLECAEKLVKIDAYKSSRDNLKLKHYQRLMINITEIRFWRKIGILILVKRRYKDLKEDKKNERSLKNWEGLFIKKKELLILKNWYIRINLKKHRL